jgi:hypothetical protein
MSFVWQKFDKIKNSTGKIVAKCKICEKIIQCSGGSTSGLRTHLRTIHDLEDPQPSVSKSEASSSKMCSEVYTGFAY